MTKHSISIIKSTLKHLHTSTYTDDEGRIIGELSFKRWLEEISFINPKLEDYKQDVLTRIDSLFRITGFLKLASMENANTKFIRENEDLCLEWSSLSVEILNLKRIGYGGNDIDNISGKRLITNESEDDCRFIAAA